MEEKNPSKGNYKPPQVDRVLRHQALADWEKKLDRKVLTAFVRLFIERRRAEFTKQVFEEELDKFAELVRQELHTLDRTKLQPVINGTGIIINTNLGRAPWPSEIGNSLQKTLTGYCNLELDLETGKRGDRNTNVEMLLRLLTGCEAALVVNNNAAAVMLCIAALARNQEVVISRGELVEIGGSFRLPDVIVSAGGILKEVGTTNRTRLEDYAKAISKNCGLFLKCHQSNFEMRGFVEETSVSELVGLGKRNNIHVLEDLGSGAFVDVTKFGFAAERLVSQSVSDGVDACLFSGDKLLGGPQAGVIVGKQEVIAALRRHPIYRAVRADKLMIAFLELVLSNYLFERSEETIPILTMAKEAPEAIEERVATFIKSATKACPKLAFSLVSTETAFGGGTSPGQVKKSFALGIQINALLNSPHKIGCDDIARMLRGTTPPVIVRILKDVAVVDFRTIAVHEEKDLLQVLSKMENEMSDHA
jgi:L-seryl-tRNA(Ser) seleniumtransferase